MKIVISSPWGFQGLTVLALQLKAELEHQDHEVVLHAWRNRYRPIGHAADAHVVRAPFQKAAAGCRVAIFPEIVEPKQWQWCRRNGIRVVWVPMWEYVKDVPSGADVIAAPTRCSARLLERLGAKNVRCCPWSLRQAQGRPSGDRRGEPVLLHSARGISGDIRNTDAVLEAFARYRAEGGTARLMVKSLVPLERFCKRPVPDGVECIGRPLTSDEHAALYRQADLMVHPTRREGIGLVILEAIAAGIPVITTDAPPMNEWVLDGVNGRTVPCRPGRRKHHIHEQEVDVTALVKTLHEAAEPDQLQRLKQGCSHGLAERRAYFTTFWKQLLADLSPRPKAVPAAPALPAPRKPVEPAELLMVTHNRWPMTARTVKRIEAVTSRPYRWIFVDNHSTDETLLCLQHHRWKQPARLVRNAGNRGKAAAMNQALRLSAAPYLVFLDNDVLLPEGWLQHVIGLLEALPEIGAAGVTFCPDRHPVRRMGRLAFRPRPFGCLAGATMAFHRALHERIGYCDEAFGRYGLFDTEWCFRVRLLGLQLAYVEPPGEHLDPRDPRDAYTRRKAVDRRRADRLWLDRSRQYISGRRPLYIPGPADEPAFETLNLDPAQHVSP